MDNHAACRIFDNTEFVIDTEGSGLVSEVLNKEEAKFRTGF